MHLKCSIPFHYLNYAVYFSVQNVMDLVPEANELLSRLSEKADRVNRLGNDLTESINKLKDNIAISREEASRVSFQVR